MSAEGSPRIPSLTIIEGGQTAESPDHQVTKPVQLVPSEPSDSLTTFGDGLGKVRNYPLLDMSILGKETAEIFEARRRRFAQEGITGLARVLRPEFSQNE